MSHWSPLKKKQELTYLVYLELKYLKFNFIILTVSGASISPVNDDPSQYGT